MKSASYIHRRQQLETYFDRTAARAWEHLTSDAPVSRIRETVRAGRQAMSDQILAWLPDRLHGKRILDAGCGTGSLSLALAARGASVTAVDISASLIEVARERTPQHLQAAIDYRVGDMLVAEELPYDHIVAMDSLIHYKPNDMQAAIAGLCHLAAPNSSSVVFTFAPRTPLLMAMKHVGRLFPKTDRSPAIEPIAEQHLRRLLQQAPVTSGWEITRTRGINTRFYKSQLMELIAP